MRLLVLSDLHVGEKARTKDLCPYPAGEKKEDSLVPSFFQSIKEDIAKHGPIKYVVISGDMTNSAQIVEYECFSKFIEDLSKTITVNIENFIFTPGNHDVDWSVFKNELLPSRIGNIIKYDTIQDGRFHQLGSIIPKTLFVEPYFDIKLFEDSAFVIYNSSWHDAAQMEDHYGTIEDEHLNVLKARLDDIQNEIDSKLKFFITHHHPYQYPNLSEKEFSCMQNGGALLDRLSEFSFDFIIHGHKHIPFFNHLEINNLPKINMLSSGSYSREIPTKFFNKNVANLYHIIDFEDVIDKKGKVISKAYNPLEKRWIDSGYDNHGIHHINYFGCKLKLDDIQNLFEKELEKLKKNEVKRLDELVSLHPEIKYLSSQAKGLLISRIEKSLGLNLARTTDSIDLLVKL